MCHGVQIRECFSEIVCRSVCHKRCVREFMPENVGQRVSMRKCVKATVENPRGSAETLSPKESVEVFYMGKFDFRKKYLNLATLQKI